MLSKGLEAVLTSAFHEVRKRRHEYLTLEHLLYAMTREAASSDILDACGADVDKLRVQLEGFFKEHLEPLPGDMDPEVVQTLSVRRVLQRAVWQKQASGKEIVEVGDVLAAMFEEARAEGAVLLEVLSSGNRAVVVDVLIRRLSTNRRSRWHRCRACRAMTPPEAFYQDNVCVGCTYDVFGILF